MSSDLDLTEFSEKNGDGRRRLKFLEPLDPWFAVGKRGFASDNLFPSANYESVGVSRVVSKNLFNIPRIVCILWRWPHLHTRPSLPVNRLAFLQRRIGRSSYGQRIASH